LQRSAPGKSGRRHDRRVIGRDEVVVDVADPDDRLLAECRPRRRRRRRLGQDEEIRRGAGNTGGGERHGLPDETTGRRRERIRARVVPSVHDVSAAMPELFVVTVLPLAGLVRAAVAGHGEGHRHARLRIAIGVAHHHRGCVGTVAPAVAVCASPALTAIWVAAPAV